ncbi:type I-E CRISPR-associated protein Cas6/Cse3/CasE [Solwaraspora sp. WMMD406]|uniref:type I-E CRISPR-associated protein Cas6/Cse3/CasE n=1 Tax=Solwaraspora sp. WMMD406 TaxID=3016095 RepID=UPI00241597AD|nr:type I-E CRISPR-associated protein Cas6/Cse3/CasE [Solwaraspora sp. WMMD406]MDG4765926.1 type I-E CRISPR-associated protein Cas6/Cse3/CasE [Solwaraspora sp. WMMD406]
MYLTRFRFNRARRDSRRLLGSPQVMHAAVMASFPQHTDHTRDHARALWRLDTTDNQPVLYIVSPGRPDLTHLVEQAGWPTTDEKWLTRPYGGFLDQLAPGQQWAFRLTANPVHNGRPKDPTADTKRYGHVTVAQQTQWLLQRAERHGFAVVAGASGEPNLMLHHQSTHSFGRRGGDRPVTLRTATYDGVLEVVDPDALRRMLTAGIGHAKAYGCGLMTLAPANAAR